MTNLRIRIGSVPAVAVLFCLMATVTSSAQTFTTLASFNRANGRTPDSSLVQGFDGNLYGTTINGGASDQGTIFIETRVPRFAWGDKNVSENHVRHNGAMMKLRACAGVAVITIICLRLASMTQAQTQSSNPVSSAIEKGVAVATHASGTFEVKLNPQSPDDKTEGSTLGRMSIDKQFHGDLEATAKGQMLTAGTEVKGSAGYVAIEQVNGTLNGRTGSFVFQHSGTLTRGAAQQSITVVPDSGTGQLVGLAGKMTVTIAAGKHSYDFEYTLPAAP